MHRALVALLAEGPAARDESTPSGARLAKLVHYIRAFRPARITWDLGRAMSPERVPAPAPALAPAPVPPSRTHASSCPRYRSLQQFHAVLPAN